MSKRTNVLVTVLIVVIIAAGGAWWMVSRIESPAEVAAKTRPPEPSPILVPVEERILSSEIITRGTGRFGLPQPISIAPSNLKGEAGLITTMPKVNEQLQEGSVLLTASGRPTFVLQGKAPAYRDLTPGISGEDVRQLQQALARFGHYTGTITGHYDEMTGEAVAAMYASGGWDAFGPTRDQATAVHSLRREAAVAEKERLAASGAVAAAARGVEAARAKAEHENTVAAAELATMRSERDRIVLDPRQTKSAKEAAEAGLTRAEAGVRAAKLAGDSDIQASLEAQRLAKLEETFAIERTDQLVAEVRLAESRLGTQIPVDEVVFVPALPVRVQELTAQVGDPARGPVMAVTDNQLVVDSSLPLDAVNLVKVGMPVHIDEQAIGIKASGSVSYVAPTSGTRGVDAYHVYFAVRVLKTSAPLENFSVRLTIPIESSAGAVIAVPVSAVSLAPNGKSRVQVQGLTGLEFVDVEPGMSADGFVQVTALQGTLTPGQLVVIGYERE
jgi:hypothetical protein